MIWRIHNILYEILNDVTPSFSEPEQIASDWWVHTTFHISPDV